MLEKLLGRPLIGRADDDAILPWWWHSQNLDERPGDGFKATGSKLMHGRGWLHMGSGRSPTLHVSWNLRSRFCHLSLHVDDNDRDITVSAALPPVALWLGVEGLPASIFKALGVDYETVRHLRDGVYLMERRTEISVHDWALWWSLWMPDGVWNHTDPKWRRGSLHFLDAIFGGMKYSSEKLSKEDVQIPMPEGTYEWTIEMERSTWLRSRWPFWPFKKVALSYKAEAKDGEQIPVPGKGENSWDCGPDAIYSSGGHRVRNVSEAIGRIVEVVLRDRKRHGGTHRYVEEGKYDPARRPEVRA